MILLAPVGMAEFGEESEDGWPIDAEGEEQLPPVEPHDDHHGHHGHGQLSQVDLLQSHTDPLNKVGPVTLYPYYPILTAEVQRLALDYPELVKLTSAGKSHAQLDLWMLEIADFENPDKVPFEEREVVFIDGGTHSNEYSAVYFVTELAQFLIEEYETNETAKWIVENRHTFLVPLVNPDGSNAMGRLNAMGVNINRNFPGTWDIAGTDMLLNNPGPSPGSEPETQVIMGLMDELQPDYINSVHCCGNLWLHPWGASHLAEDLDFYAEDYDMFNRTCDEAFSAVRQYCGEVWSTIYPATGTTVDEGYHRVGASSWTYEMSGRGAIAPWGQPAIIDDVRVQEVESWEGTLHAFLNVHKYGAHPELIAMEADGDGLWVTVENIGYGRLVAGNITIGNATVALPEIGPSPANESQPRNMTTVYVPGDFEAGELEVELDWTKRIRHAPQGFKTELITLVEHEGRLIADLPEAGLLGNTTDVDESLGEIPAVPWIGVALATMLTLGLFYRRRSE